MVTKVKFAECLLIRKVSGVTFGRHVAYSLSVSFLFLNFVHNDCVYQQTYEVFVLGTISLLVSNCFVNLFPLCCL